MQMSLKTVAMVGLGYIGLPTAAVMASRGLNVIGIDIDQRAVDIINSGGIHIVEPDLEALVHEVVRTGKLRATTIPEAADAFLIAVPTPFHENHEPDMTYVKAAVLSIAPVLKAGDLIVLESTSPVGSTEQMAKWLAAARPDLSFPDQTGKLADVSIAYCPERVLPGKVIHELVENARVVGGLTEKCGQRAKALYKLFVRGDCLITDSRTAEMCKLTENSFRDVNIAFANELSIICDKLSIDVWELIRLANRHPRVNILQPGPGVGGHCIAVDPWFIIDSAPEEARLIRVAREVNDGKPEFIVSKVVAAAGKLENPVIACLGLSFKPDIDDLRESPAVDIVASLARKNLGSLLVVEPHITKLPEQLREGIRLVSLDEALVQADIFVMLVDHQNFHQRDWSLLTSDRFIDSRGIASK